MKVPPLAGKCSPLPLFRLPAKGACGLLATGGRAPYLLTTSSDNL